MRKVIISVASILLAAVIVFWGFITYSAIKSYKNIFGTYKFEYIVLGERKVGCGEGSLTEDYIVFVFREDGSFTASEKGTEEDTNGTWTKRDDKTYDLVLDGDSESDDVTVRTAVFENKRCKILSNSGKVAVSLKYYSAIS